MKAGYSIIFLAVALMLLPFCKTNRPVYKKEIGSFAAVIGKKWNLVELNRKPFKDTIAGKIPYIIFKMEDSSLTGSGVCNSLYAKFMPVEENLLSISQLSFTKMLCDNVIYDIRFFDALRLTDSWRLRNDTLFLLNGKKKNLTVFTQTSDK